LTTGHRKLENNKFASDIGKFWQLVEGIIGMISRKKGWLRLLRGLLDRDNVYKYKMKGNQ